MAKKKTRGYWNNEKPIPYKHNKGELFYNSFVEYLKDFPEAIEYTRYNTWISSGQLFFQCTLAPHSLLYGNYAHVHYSNCKAHGNIPALYSIVILDGDDGMIRKEFKSESELPKELEDLKLLAPCSFDELVECFGYYYDM